MKTPLSPEFLAWQAALSGVELVPHRRAVLADSAERVNRAVLEKAQDLPFEAQPADLWRVLHAHADTF